MAYAESTTDQTAVAPGPGRRVEHLPSLTPLRGIAALWVVVFHFCWRFPNMQPDDYGVVREGYLAVDMFFVLSGFVISHVYKDVFAKECTARRYCDFLKARIARIYPLHLVMLMLFIAASMNGKRRARSNITMAGTRRLPSSAPSATRLRGPLDMRWRTALH